MNHCTGEPKTGSVWNDQGDLRRPRRDSPHGQAPMDVLLQNDQTLCQERYRKLKITNELLTATCRESITSRIFWLGCFRFVNPLWR